MSLFSMRIDCSSTSSYDSEDEIDGIAFHKACAEGNLKVVKTYLAQQGINMNVGEHIRIIGFHLACSHGNLNVVQFFVQQGFDMNVDDFNGCTGFHLACSHGNLNVVQFLLHQRFDMNVTDNIGITGFHCACGCGKGNLNVVQFLVRQGFDMNVCDNTGCTGFHYACFKGNLNVVQFLVQQGFDMNVGDDDGKTGLEMLVSNRQYNSRDNELFLPCVLFLIEAGATLNKSAVFEELNSAIQNRIIEITFMKQIIFEKWTGRIAQVITDLTMEPFTNTSLQNLSEILD